MQKGDKNVIVLDDKKVKALVNLSKKTTEETKEQKPLEIKNARLADLTCSYSYELLQGKTKGDVINRKGTNLIHDDLTESFENLDVFIAHIDGAFKTWSNNQTQIQKLEESGELDLYKVNQIKIVGVEENKSLILVGYKDTDFGIIKFETPKIKLEKSNYLYIEELNQRLAIVLDEVEQYMNGKSAPVPEQTYMDFAEEDHDVFENAKVGD